MRRSEKRSIALGRFAGRALAAGGYAVVLALLAACGDGGSGGEGAPGGNAGAPRESRAALIVPHRVSYATAEDRVEAVGTSRARAAAVITPETNGEVTDVSFETGDLIEAGAPLLRLESDEERLAVDLAVVAVKEAEQLLARYRRIENTGAVSDSAIDEARTALQSAKIELERAELALSERTIRAPFTGHVGLTDIDPGARIDAQTEITRIDDRRILYVDFPAPEEVFGALSIGDIVTLTPFAQDQVPLRAEIAALDSRIDPMTRAFTARAAIDNEGDTLRPGMSFRVSFAVPSRRYPLVPEASIVWGSDGAYLWAVEDGKAVRVPLTIVSRRQGAVLIDAALPEGGIIVAEGVQKVREGAEVTFAAPADGKISGSTAGAGASAGAL